MLLLPFDADLLLNVIEQVFEMERENFFGSGKNKRIITAKEVFILIGKESGATITERSGIVGLDQSNAGRRFDAARQKCKTDPGSKAHGRKFRSSTNRESHYRMSDAMKC
ncbi:MAG: hypothetical protein IPP63_16370 [Chloracidobacterium sp.]|nr:hypothetical protein [Chloracidobacterium sp.]